MRLEFRTRIAIPEKNGAKIIWQPSKCDTQELKLRPEH